MNKGIGILIVCVSTVLLWFLPDLLLLFNPISPIAFITSTFGKLICRGMAIIIVVIYLSSLVGGGIMSLIDKFNNWRNHF